MGEWGIDGILCSGIQVVHLQAAVSTGNAASASSTFGAGNDFRKGRPQVGIAELETELLQAVGHRTLASEQCIAELAEVLHRTLALPSRSALTRFRVVRMRLSTILCLWLSVQ
jgi:hypothetical protein